MFWSRGKAAAVPAAEITKTDRQWRSQLTAEQYRVLRRRQTELPFTGELTDNHEDGMYHCAGCGGELFSSAAKFESRSGWPSFSEPAVADAVTLREDRSMFMHRTEVLCRRCGGHLGHVFGDGPAPAGDRYCINSCSMTFDPAEAAGSADPAGTEPPAEDAADEG